MKALAKGEGEHSGQVRIEKKGTAAQVLKVRMACGLLDSLFDDNQLRFLPL